MKIFGILCFVGAAVMYIIGANSSAVSELKDYFWIPLPVGAFFLMLSRQA
jgi:hypothetical protein